MDECMAWKTGEDANIIARARILKNHTIETTGAFETLENIIPGALEIPAKPCTTVENPGTLKGVRKIIGLGA